MKKTALLSALAVLSLICAGCGDGNKQAVCTATVKEIYENTIIVTPVDGSAELSSSDKFSVGIENIDFSSAPKVGDTVEITYSGEMLLTYPAFFDGITDITIK